MTAHDRMPTRRSWGRATSARLEAQLVEAERHGSLCSPTSSADRDAFKRRLRAGALVQPRAGMFARRDYWKALDPAERALHIMRTIAKRHPRWTFCGPSAAQAYGLPVTWSYLTTTHVVAGKRSKGHATKTLAFHSVTNDATEMVGGLPVTSFWRTVFDCLRWMEPPDALAVADAALRLSASRRDQLVSHLRAWRKGHPGLLKALQTAQFADPLSESGGESIARMTMLELGFELPLLQVVVPDPLNPRRPLRVDYLWITPDGRFIFGEFDGRAKSEDQRLTRGKSKEQVQHEERLRESRISLYGIPVVRFDLDMVRSRARFARLLDAYGVPRRREPKLEPPEFAPIRNELLDLDGFIIVVSVYDGQELARAR